jgi:hypothetical protein
MSDRMHHVLACGASFHGLEFPERDRAREELRQKVAEAGLTFVEHYWVWDETDRAQLLVRSTQSACEAEKFRSYLERHGVGARIITRLPPGSLPPKD